MQDTEPCPHHAVPICTYSLSAQTILLFYIHTLRAHIMLFLSVYTPCCSNPRTPTLCTHYAASAPCCSYMYASTLYTHYAVHRRIFP